MDYAYDFGVLLVLLHVTGVKYLDGYRVWLRFSDGAEGIIDLESELYGEVFTPLRDLALFRKVGLTSRTIEWPNGADFAPEFLRENIMQTELSL